MLAAAVHGPLAGLHLELFCIDQNFHTMMLTIEEIANGQDVVASYQAFVFGPVAAAALIAVAFATQQSLIY